MMGRFIGVGVGPGDPELLTLRAVRLIQSATVIAFVVDGKGNSYARQTAAQFIRPEQMELPLRFSMLKDHSERIAERQIAADRLLSRLNTGMDVVFITEGDPLLYSSFQHLLASLPDNVPVEICPGISAMNAAAAAAGFSLALEDSRLVISPAESGLEHLKTWLAQNITVVLFKTGRHIQNIKKLLTCLDTPCELVLVEQVSTCEEAIFRRLQDLPDDFSPYFSILMIRPDSSGKRKSVCTIPG
jgi:precorrin-2/cobalt-factor-2 C20-methyltransferase